MTHPFPVPCVISRPPKTMTPEEEDAYYTAHAEPIPRWLRALFALPRRAIAALRKERPETQAGGDDRHGSRASARSTLAGGMLRRCDGSPS